MDPAANFSQRIRIKRDNFAVGIVALQGQHRYAVSRGIAKLWGNHRTVADIKIDIGGHKIICMTHAVMDGLWNHINRKAGVYQRVICFCASRWNGSRASGLVGRLINTRLGPVNGARLSM